ncbi:hypothetical protein CT676_18275 [Bradyrhizobium sp. MOS001]|nr:hypothetical protein CT676_18275 [Bradyrhizobium sp. MOS001]
MRIESADQRWNEGCGVSSVASPEMAAGLSAFSVTEVLARELSPRGMGRSSSAARSTPGHDDNGVPRSGSMFAGATVSRQNHTEIMFGGVGASCYSRYPMGAEGISTNTSRRPN